MMEHKVMPKINMSSVQNYCTSHTALTVLMLQVNHFPFHAWEYKTGFFICWKNAVLLDIQELTLKRN
jgi:hypothetical protein